jgi:DGQHR domain-containing protein
LSVLKVNALRILQNQDVPLYLFGVNGRLISQFATVHFAHRVGNGQLKGYQRERVGKHIQEIREYLEQAKAVLPNAIVISFDSQVQFTPLQNHVATEWGTFGTLSIPLIQNGGPKPGFIVDGQQRATALSELDPRRNFPAVIVGFQSPTESFQREQFVLINKTKALPKDLLHELLPHVTAHLPKGLRHRQVAAKILEYLRFDTASPFFQRIRGIGASGDECNISQAAVLSVIQDSLKRGILSRFSGRSLEDTDARSAAEYLTVFFIAVKNTWPDAWDGSPRTSRLVHGAGIYALGHLMNELMKDVDIIVPATQRKVQKRLALIADKCAWTSGKWSNLNCNWDELQNTSQDKRRLTECLLKLYTKQSRR